MKTNKNKKEPRVHYGMEEAVIVSPEYETTRHPKGRVTGSLAIDLEGFVELRTEFKEHRIQTNSNFEDIKTSLKGLDDMKTQFTAHVTSDAVIFQHLTNTLDRLDSSLKILSEAHQQDIGSKITRKQVWAVVGTTVVLIPAIISLVIHFLFAHK